MPDLARVTGFGEGQEDTDSLDTKNSALLRNHETCLKVGRIAVLITNGKRPPKSVLQKHEHSM